jgi:hypothetical protein
MKVESPGPSSPAISEAYNTNAFLTSLPYDDSCDLNLTLMPQYFAESPASSLSTPTTQTSFEDFSSSSSHSYTPVQLAPIDGFPASSENYFDGSFLTPNFQVKQETPFFFDPIDTFNDLQYTTHFEYSRPEPIHRSIEMPASPPPEQQSFPAIEPFSAPSFPALPTFPGIDAFDRSESTANIHPHTYTVSDYASSSEGTILDQSPPTQTVSEPKKLTRATKPDKDIRCDHCGIDKTPLWRKVPDKENAYHWYSFDFSDFSNACGLYFKSNGCFRSMEGDGRIIRHSKKARKSGDALLASRSGPVTANRNVTCANCGTNNTVLWRKGPDGQSPLCNPCGLFYKLHGSHRSPEKRKEIHRRNRAGKKRYSIPTVGSWTSEEGDDDVDSPAAMEFTFRQEYAKRESVSRECPPQPAEWPQTPYRYHWAGVHARC